MFDFKHESFLLSPIQTNIPLTVDPSHKQRYITYIPIRSYRNKRLKKKYKSPW